MARKRHKRDDPAPLPDELPMLSAVVANPGDEDVKLVYSDWLEEKGDRRGPFLRKFVRALQSGKDLPGGRGISAVWQEMAGLNLLRRIFESGLVEYRARIMGLARPALALTSKASSESRIAVGTTKLGGTPELPAGARWPRCDQGPLEFLAQLDLAEFHNTFAGRALPPAGLLSFFSYHNYPEAEYGDGREGPFGYVDGLRVLHTEDTSRLHRLDPPEDLTDDLGPPRKPCRIAFTQTLDLPEPDDTWSDRYGLKPAQLETLRDAGAFGPAGEADHQLFGYSHVTVLVQDPIPGPEWQLLIRFSSDDKLGWGWGDGHHLFWYIKTADLQRGYFEDTRAIDG